MGVVEYFWSFKYISCVFILFKHCFLVFFEHCYRFSLKSNSRFLICLPEKRIMQATCLTFPSVFALRKYKAGHILNSC